MRLQVFHKPRPPHYKIVGLTLIEMMLVVTIIAVATLTGIKMLKNRAEINTINTVVTQMQSVAQGVVLYYMTNQNNWPTTTSTPTTLVSLVDSTVKYPYFPQQTLCTPFPANNSNAYCKNFAEIEGETVSNAGYYNLVLVTDSNSSALAIAGKLPNAMASGTTVTMSVSPPAQYFSSNPNKGWIVSAGVTSFAPFVGGNTNYGSAVSGGNFLPFCPPGFEGHIMYFPQRYETYGGANITGDNPWGMHMAEVTASGNGTPSNVYSDDYTDPNDPNNHISTDPSQSVIFQYGEDFHHKPAYAVTLGDTPDNSDQNDMRHQAFFMTFCLPNGHWGTNFINSDWPQDGQCNQSWADFIAWHQSNSGYPECSSAWSSDIVGSPNGH